MCERRSGRGSLSQIGPRQASVERTHAAVHALRYSFGQAHAGQRESSSTFATGRSAESHVSGVCSQQTSFEDPGACERKSQSNCAIMSSRINNADKIR